jgi:alpha-beta hydrolase superfamily lysophospholipase
MTALAKHEVRLPSGERIALDWAPPAGATGNVAVFVHGLGSHRRGEKALHFAERFRQLDWGFLSVDLRGHGESDGSMEDLSLTRCLEDLGAAIGWLPAGIVPRLLIGSSMGGAVVAWYGVLHPEPQRHVALIAPSLRFFGRFADMEAAELEAWQRSGFRNFASEWIDLKIGYGLVADGANYRFERLLRDHRAATLILHGMRDTAVPWRESVAFVEQARAEQVDLLLVKDGDHRLTAQKDYLFEAIVAWLRARMSGV